MSRIQLYRSGNNGNFYRTEKTVQKFSNWAKKRKAELAHIQPGKPAQSAYIERFQRAFREDNLDAYLFQRLDEVREVVGLWIEEYNAIRPHETLQGLSPKQFTAARA